METLTLESVTAIVPALNEAMSIGAVVQGLIARGIGRVFVVDGGSTDSTAALARRAGATVVVQPERGYGSACIAGVEAVGPAVLLFLDGDGAEDLDGAVRVAWVLLAGGADLVLARRVVGAGEAGALTPLAVLGNAVCSWWLRLAFRAQIHDFPSLKAVRIETYDRLGPSHRRYGWTAQFLARAARSRLRIVEVPVPYHRRAGTSKVSGTARGALTAGAQMVVVIAEETLAAMRDSTRQKLARIRAAARMTLPIRSSPGEPE